MAVSRKVLVIGDDTRSFLATVRSLGRQGLEVHVAPYDLGSPALRSKYIRRVHRLPYYLDGGARWLAALQAVCREENFDLVIPCEERALLPLCRHRDVLEKLCRLAIPDAGALEAFFDKVATRELAAAAGVPVARGRLLTPADTPAGLVDEFSLPLVLKHRHSYAWSDLYVRKAAAVIGSQAELERWLNANRDRSEEVLVEAFFAGLGGGVSVLCDRGKVLLAFEHQRAHEVTGSSFYRRSVALDRARLDAVAAMTAKIGYTGLAMFEFKLDTRTGQWRLLEVNARPWGSLPLPVALGVDFPYALYRLLVDGAASTPAEYRADIYGRNLIPDLWQLRSTLQALQGATPQQLRHILAWLWEFRRVVSGREVQDLWVSDDRAPAIAQLGRFALDRLAALPAWRWWSRSTAAHADRQRIVAAVRAAGRPVDVVFLCQGNICRSPYAEIKLRHAMPANTPVRIGSAGLLPRNARPSPPAAKFAARQHGVDLAAHRSRHAYAETVAAASLIFVFDAINLRSFVARFPELRQRVFALGALDGNAASAEIHDPDGRSEAVFDETYARIDRCIEALAALLKEGV